MQTCRQVLQGNLPPGCKSTYFFPTLHVFLFVKVSRVTFQPDSQQLGQIFLHQHKARCSQGFVEALLYV